MTKLFALIFLMMSSSVYSEEIFVLKAKIGDHLFNDLLVYESCSNQFPKGSVTVPGVFTSRIEAGSCNQIGSREDLNFKIKVSENGEEYFVTYSLSIINGDISGNMFIDGKLMGTITGNSIYKGQ